MAEAAPKDDAPQETETTQKTDVSKPQNANWEHRRERGFVRLWQAAMLSLNYEPTVANREVLEASNPTDYNEYRRRKGVLEMQYGHHKFLSAVEHEKQGEETRNKYVTWDNFVNFTKEMRWCDVAQYEQSESQSSSWERPSPQLVDEVDDELLEETQIIVMGSLLDMLERVSRGEALVRDELPSIDGQAVDAKKPRRLLIGHDKRLNVSALTELTIDALENYVERDRGFKKSNIDRLLNTARTAFDRAKRNRA